MGYSTWAMYSANIYSVLSVKALPVTKFDDLKTFEFHFYAHEFSTVVQDIMRVYLDFDTVHA